MFIQLNNISFTAREIDVIACMLAGRSTKKIASILSISVKTAQNHIYNIMFKLGYNCREKIIDFLQISEHVFYLRKHYIDLLIKNYFDLELKKIFALTQKTVGVSLYYMDQKDIFRLRLCQDLQNAGLKLISIPCGNKQFADQDYNARAVCHSIYIISNSFIDWFKEASNKIDISKLHFCKNGEQANVIGILQEEVKLNSFLEIQKKLIEFIDLKQENNYYFLFFKLLNKLIVDPIITSSLELFRKKYDMLFNLDVSLQQSSVVNSTSKICKKSIKKQIIYTAFNLPRRNNNFVGRNNYLKQLSTNLYENKFGMITQVVCGLSGIGKTQLAMEFAYKALENEIYKEVLWIPAETANTINLAYQKYAEQLNLDIKCLNSKELQKLIYDHLSNSYLGYKILFILDNVESSKNINNYINLLYEQSAGYFIPHVLITSRSQDWSEPLLCLEIFTVEEAYTFIKTQLPTEDKLAINNLSNTLAYFPLVLSHAVAYIRASSNIGDYLTVYNQNKKNYIGNFLNIEDFYTKSLWNTWIITLERLSLNAQKFLSTIAYLDSDSIPIDAFHYTSVIDRMNIIKELRTYSLITLLDNKSFKVHKLLQEVIRLNHYKDITFINYAIDLLEDNFDFNYLKSKKWKNWSLYLVHALTVAKHSIEYPNQLIERGIKLYAKAAMFMTHVFIGAQEVEYFWLKFIDITQPIHENESTSLLMAIIKVRLSIVRFVANTLEGSKENFNLAISMYKRILQINSVITKIEADLLNILRWVHIDENIPLHEKIIHDLGHTTMLGKLYTKTLVRPLEAISNYTKTLSLLSRLEEVAGVRESILYHKTETIYHLGIAYICAGNLFETEKLLNQMKVLIQEGHTVPLQQSMIYFTTALFNMHIGKCKEAEVFFHKSINILPAIFTSKHILIKTIETYMGCNYYIVGNISLAKILLEKATRYWNRANYSWLLWFSKLYLAKVYESLGRYEGAIEIFRTIEKILMNNYKENLNNLIHFQMIRAENLLFINVTTEISYWQEVLDYNIKLFGENHYQVARYRYILGQALAHAKQVKKAIVQYKKSLAILSTEKIKHQNLLKIQQQNILTLEKIITLSND